MWTNYGDVNPLEHGGLWIDYDKDECYRVISLGIFDDSYLFGECYVDLSDSWINWEDVLDFVGCDTFLPPEQAVVAVISYYPIVNFGSYKVIIDRQEAIRRLNEYDIFVS